MTTTPINKAPSMEAKKKLFDMILAFVKSQCIYVATRLGIFNLLQDEESRALRVSPKRQTQNRKGFMSSSVL